MSQNLMHADLSITDGVYGVLTEQDTGSPIAGLSGRINGNDSEDLIEQLESLLGALKRNG